VFSAFRTIMIGVVAVSAIGACSDSSSTSTQASNTSTNDGGATAVVGCAGQGDTYAAGLTKTGTNGVFTFTLVSASPSPPTLDANVWTLAIAPANATMDASATPTSSNLTVTPFMPLMGHGSDQVPQVAANADGTFTISDVYLFMNGLWTVTINVMSGSAITDSAVFTFCIDG
jgi:hypothetical protein